jgi:hypothetical protein
MSLFGNTNNQGGGLFGNTSNNQGGGGLFGNTTNNQGGGGLFGNTSNNQGGGGLFGNTSNNQGGGGLFGNNTSNQAGGGLFGNNNQSGGGLFGNNNNQTGSGLFGNNNNNQSGGGLFGNNNNQSGGGLFGNNNNNQSGGGLFGNNNNNIQSGGGIFGNNNNTNQNQQISNSEFYTTVTPVITLSNNNDIKDVQLYKLPPIFQEVVLKLKLNLKNQEIKLDELQRYSQRLIELIDQSNKSVEKLSEFNNFINQKLNKYELLVNQIKDNFNFISESFEEEQANIHLMEQDLGYKIEIPSKFLINYSQNLYNRTTLFQQRLNDIITLIKLYSSQTNNDYDFDCDIMESTIAEFIKIVRYLLEGNEKQERMINEMYQVMIRFASNYGENPETVINNINQYCIESNSI